MFIWDEPQAKAKPAAKPRMLPRIPSTGWQTPMDFPNLSGCKVLSIDTESFDPYLLTEGAGWARGKSHMVGASIATADKAWYFPIRHEICPEQNMPVEGVLRFLKDVLETPNVHKVGVNLTYDIGMLQAEGVHVKGVLHDVGYGEALLEERGRTSLDALATKYLKLHKETSLLYQWSHEAYGGDPSDQRANIYRCPPSLVGHYAEADARLPLQVFYPIWERLNAENLADLYRLECDLIPLYVAMRYAGVRVDLGEAERLHYELGEAIKVQRTQVFQVAGSEINVDSALDLAKSFDSLGFKYPRTPKDAPSFTKEFLQASECPLAAEVLELRKLQKLQGTFVGKIIDTNTNGMMHTNFHPLRSDKAGTRSGRYSSNFMNLQQIPSRDKVWAKRLRGLFIPDDGHIGIRKYDYSSIEYRMLVHYAVGKGSDEVRQQFAANPETDYHGYVMDMVAPVAGWDISTDDLKAYWRKPLKVVNFMLVFGGGKRKLIRSLGLEQHVGELLYNSYHDAIPYAKATMKAAADEAETKGYVETILGRRSRFEMYEPLDGEGDPLSLHAALRAYGHGNIKMAHLHKALNRKLQGSAADLLKKSLHVCYTGGLFDEIGLPRLLVHDECVFSDQGTARKEAWKEMQHIFETSIPLRVPVIFEPEFGVDWGHCKAI